VNRPALHRLLICTLAVACSGGDGGAVPVILATTTSVEDSGLLEVLVPAFEADHPEWSIDYMAVGSGQALELGRRGDVDAIIAHSPADEEQFMADGHGIDRRAVMHNEFVIAGPPDDPAGIRGTADAVSAFARILSSGAAFVSRADDSGTHRREQSIWSAAGLTPTGAGYVEAGVGMGDALRVASERGAYILTDIATFLYARDHLDLTIQSRGDERLINAYSVIRVTNAANAEGARVFADWITSDTAQQLIAEFGRDRLGQPLFVPDGLPQPVSGG